jgi:hypothetical protein
LKQLSEEVADPECREVAGHSHMTLLRIETEAEEVVHGQKNVEIATKESLLVKLREVRCILRHFLVCAKEHILRSVVMWGTHKHHREMQVVYVHNAPCDGKTMLILVQERIHLDTILLCRLFLKGHHLHSSSGHFSYSNARVHFYSSSQFDQGQEL